MHFVVSDASHEVNVALYANMLQTVSKMFRTEFAQFGVEIGEEMKAFTASGSRKLAVSSLREGGADRDQQKSLARHMAHDLRTADRHYDRASPATDEHLGVTTDIAQFFVLARP